MWMWKKFKLVYRKPLFGTKSLGKGGRMVVGLLWKWDVTLKIKFSCEYYIHKQYHYVWKNPWIKKCHNFLLWQTIFFCFTTNST
jgi:hypothetical protein